MAESDLPQYVPGFSATTIFISGICVLAPINAWRFGKENGSGGIVDVFKLRRGGEGEAEGGEQSGSGGNDAV